MAGSIDSQPPDGPRPSAGRPARPAATGVGALVPWIVIPAVLGSATGILVVVVPWSRFLLVFALVVSGLAWLLRVASDWLVERAGPQRGVVLIGTVLFSSWLIMAVAPPTAFRSAGFGTIPTPAEPSDPYALPPGGARGPFPNLQGPSEAIDPVKPLRDLVMPEPTYEPPAPPTPPADGRRVTVRMALRLSSGESRFGEGVVLIADVAGDGRPVHGEVAFIADGAVVQRRILRIQGTGSQIEYRLVGLAPGTHKIQARYRGSRTFAPADSPIVEHRVARR